MVDILNFKIDDRRFEYPCREMLQQFAPETAAVFNEPEVLDCIEVVVQENTLALTWFRGDHLLQAESYPITTLPLEKEAFKRFLYRFLAQYFGRELEWGTMTGIKPVKMAHGLLRQGLSPEAVQKRLKETYQTADQKLALITEIAQREIPLIYPLNRRRVSVYIGIPICMAKCSYCSFISTVADKKGHLAETYLKNLCREIEETGQFLKAHQIIVDTLYIGGGTPSILNEGQLERLLTVIDGALELSALREYTFESGRPETTTREKLESLKAHEVDRICFNPQSMNADTLKAVGRFYAPEDIRRGMAMIREIGFKAVNMDLILGLNHESQDAFLYSLKEVMAMAPENITVHSLSVKKGSAIKSATGRQVENLYPPVFYEAVQAQLRGAGYQPYYLYRQKYTQGNGENIGYSLPGKEGIYNILMMAEKQSIIGIGAGSSGKLFVPEEDRFERVFTVKDIRTYNDRYEEIFEKKMKSYRELFTD